MPLSGFKFKNGADIAIKASMMTLDTGLSYMMAPQEDVDIVMGALEGKGIKCADAEFGTLSPAECSCTNE